jgi:hypothetical protein
MAINRLGLSRPSGDLVMSLYDIEVEGSLSPPSAPIVIYFLLPGIGTFSKKTSAVSQHLMPILALGGPLDTPPKSLSTIKAVTLSVSTPVFSSFTGVLANTCKKRSIRRQDYFN